MGNLSAQYESQFETLNATLSSQFIGNVELTSLTFSPQFTGNVDLINYKNLSPQFTGNVEYFNYRILSAQEEDIFTAAAPKTTTGSVFDNITNNYALSSSTIGSVFDQKIVYLPNLTAGSVFDQKLVYLPNLTAGSVFDKILASTGLLRTEQFQDTSLNPDRIITPTLYRLSQTTIDLKTLGTTNLITLSANTLIMGVILEATNISGVTGAPIVSVGSNVATDNIFNSKTINLAANQQIYSLWLSSAASVGNNSGEIIKFKVNTASVATNYTVIAHLIGLTS